MLKSEERIKDFLRNEEKVKALASDEVFIEKVSGGKATPETYAEEFRKLGLELSADEAKEVRKTTMKLLDIPVEELADISLENVAGGALTVEDVQQQVDDVTAVMKDNIDMMLGAQNAEAFDPARFGEAAQSFKRLKTPSGSSVASGFVAATVIGAVGALGCSVASAVCKAASVNAMKNGDAAKSATYQKAAIGLGVCVAPFAAIGIGGGYGLAKTST